MNTQPSLDPRRHFAVVQQGSGKALQEKCQNVARAFFRANGPVDDVIELYDYWVREVIPDQIAARQLFFSDGSRYSFTFDHIELPHGSDAKQSDEKPPLYPAEAVARGLTYQFDVFVKAQYHPFSQGEKPPEARPFRLCSIPAMVGARTVCWTRDKKTAEKFGRSPPSARDTTAGKARETLLKVDEVLLDKMGLDRTPLVSYFVIEGTKYVVLLNEKIRMNVPVTYYEKHDEPRYVTSMKCSTNAGSLQVRVALHAKAKAGPEVAYVMELLTSASLRKREKIRFSGGMDYVKGEGVTILRPSTVKATDAPPSYINVFNVFSLFGLGRRSDVKERWLTAEAIMKYILSFVEPEYRERARGVLSTSAMDFEGQKGNEDQDGRAVAFFRKKFNLSDGDAAIFEMKSILRDELFTQVNPAFSTRVAPRLDRGLSEEEIQKEDEEDLSRMRLLAYMVARNVLVVLGALKPEDKNSWANNFMFSAGKVMEVHFNWQWAEIVASVQEHIRKDKNAGQMLPAAIAAKLTANDKLLNSYIHAFKTKKWESFSRTTLATTLVEPLRTETYWNLIAQIGEVNVKAHRRVRDRDLRMIQPSQAGYLCPAETPERDNCGLVKHRSLGCRLSLESPRVRDSILKRLAVGAKPGDRSTTKLVINGVIEGWCEGQTSFDRLRLARRRGEIARDVALVYTRDEFLSRYGRPVRLSEDALYVYSDGGRPIRPLFVVDEASRRLMMDVQDARSGLKDYWGMSFEELLESGRVEYLDPWEQETNCYVAQGAWYLEASLHQLAVATKDLAAAEADFAGQKKKRAAALNDADSVGDFLAKLVVANPVLHREFQTAQRALGGLQHRLNAQTGFEEDRWAAEEEAERLEERLLWILDNSLQPEQQKATAPETDELAAKKNAEVAARLKSARSYAIDLARATRFTHCEIHPLLIFGAAAASTVLANNTYGPRTTFASGQQKQTMGIHSTNPMGTFEKTKVMVYPTLPVAGTLVEDLVRSNIHPTGLPVVVAEIIHSGFTQEDAILVSRSFLQRGGFLYCKYSDYHTDFDSTVNMSCEWINPSLKIVNGKPLIPPERCKAISADGLPVIGRYVREGDVLIGKVKSVKTTKGERSSAGVEIDYEDASTIVKATDAGRIHSYMVAPGQNGSRIIKVRIIAVREPVVGDKFTDRTGQKATIGLIRDEADMPRSAVGMVPDIIVNIHAIPSRMTMNKLFEMFLGKRGALEARRYDASSFQDLDPDSVSSALARFGFEGRGTEEFYSGITGEPLKVRVFVGVAHYFPLKHNVMDKIQLRGMTGSFNAESKEPVGGTGKEGGAARMSELERQAMISHGASTTIRDRFCLSSNPFSVAVCYACNTAADMMNGVYRCPNPECKSEGPFGVINMKYSQYRISGLLAGAMVNTQYVVRPAGEEQMLDLFRKVRFHAPPPAVKSLEDVGKNETIKVGDIRVLLARKRRPEDQAGGEHKDQDGDVYDVLAAITKFTSGQLLSKQRSYTQRDAARRKEKEEQRRKMGAFEYLDAPRRPSRSYFLHPWSETRVSGNGEEARLQAARRDIFATLRRPDGRVIRTTTLSEVWKELNAGKITNPE